ncbi:hypothetical protein Acsp03_40340 [Actinomadura sp. NBRC 104412]|uniref:peptidase inhibitor family I36 protein n=1 Tax=Actinomadura sp. NBRC 104412 TaxID=3032203 RepID=UPI0024A5E65C|nr:peptidase inhibitor family I36 protein [Actinomadura sp. NBRC 104412]GLZ06568.1 hypothetical protein Acsp03_40340 [Actinomadura sp. NBRC 104412]
MQRITGMLVAGVASVFFAAMAPQTSAAPVVQGGKDGVCDNGEFCLYTQTGQHGSVVDRRAYETDLSTTHVRNGAASWRNLTGVDWMLFDGVRCTGNTYRLHVADGNAHDIHPSWRKRIKSIARVDRTGACRNG